jgi:hypothetical protein
MLPNHPAADRGGFHNGEIGLAIARGVERTLVRSGGLPLCRRRAAGFLLFHGGPGFCCPRRPFCLLRDRRRYLHALRRLAHAQLRVCLVTDRDVAPSQQGPSFFSPPVPGSALEKIDVESLAFDALQHANFGALADARDRRHQS